MILKNDDMHAIPYNFSGHNAIREQSEKTEEQTILLPSCERRIRRSKQNLSFICDTCIELPCFVINVCKS